MIQRIITATLAIIGISKCYAFTNNIASSTSRTNNSHQQQHHRTSPPLQLSETSTTPPGNLHGQSACFLPILQNDDEYIAPRIVQIAGAYPEVDLETYLSISSEPPAEMGQWSYDFSDPNGPQMGTVALPGISSVYETEDPVVIIADHLSLNVPLTNGITEPVDLVVLCDRSRKHFAERRFLVLELDSNPGMISIAAFNEKGEIPSGAKIHGQVTFVQIPWLPMMQRKKSGFMEEDALFS